MRLIDGSGNEVTTLTVAGEGTWSVDTSNGQVTFTPEQGFTGDPTPVHYTVKDTTGLTSNQATITVDYEYAPEAGDAQVSFHEAKDTPVTTYTFSSSDFDYSDADGDPFDSIKITSLPGIGTLNYDGSAVTVGQVISVADIDAGKLTFTPADKDDSGSDEYLGDTRPDGSTVADGDLGDQGEDYAVFNYEVSDGANWSNDAQMAVDVIAKADTPTLSLSATSITTSVTIDKDNLDGSGQGFTITAYNADGSVGSFSTHDSNPEGFGVAGQVDGTDGDPGRGDASEIQYDTTLNSPEKVVVTFDHPVDSVDLSLAWNDPTENVEVAFYRNGILVGTAQTGGGTDEEDGPYHFQPADGSVFDRVEFYPPDVNDDFLIHSITYNRTEIRSDGTIVVEEHSSSEIDLQAALTDTDGSESLKVEVQDIPDGFTLTDGTHSFTSDGTTTSVDISDWDRANLVLKTPDVDQDTTYTLHVVATATEYSNNDQASVTQNLNVTVKAVTTAVAPTISGPEDSHVSEEGLLVANGAPYDGNPDSDPDATNDTTDATTHSGQFTVFDLNGDSLSVSLSAPSGSYSSNGDSIDWSVSADGHTLTGTTHNGGLEILTVTIDDDGNYTTTLKGPIDHPDTSTEDTVTIPITVTVSDGDSDTPDVSSTLNVVVEDDSPIANDSEITVEASTAPVTTNVIIIYDRSGSMNDNPDGTTAYADRHNLAIDAVNSMIEGYNALGTVNAAVVDFSSDGTWHDWVSGNDTADQITSILTAVPVYGGTNYEEGIQAAMDGYDPNTAPSADQTVVYFISDGDPNGGDLDNNLNDWENFITQTLHADVYAVGIGNDVSLAGNNQGSLDRVALLTDGDSGNDQTAVVLNDEKGLAEYLHNTVSVSKTETGNVSGNGGTLIDYGADGPGYIQSIEIGGTTYSYDGTNDTVTFSTPKGGEMTFNFLTGDYTYNANVTLDNAGESEVFTLTTQDADGDTDTSTLTVNLSLVTNPTVATDTIITNTIHSDGDTLTVSQEALLANDVDLDGDSFKFTSAQNADNGTVAYSASDVTFTVNTLPSSGLGSSYTTLSGAGTNNIDISDRSDYGAVTDSNAPYVLNSHLASVLVEDSYVGTYNSNYYDKYTLNLKAGDILYLDMDNVQYDRDGDGTDATIMMNLRDSNNNILKGSYYGTMFNYDPASAYGGDASVSDDTRDPYMEYRVTQDGTYYVYVYDADGDGGGSDGWYDDAFSYDLWATIDDRYVTDGGFDYTIEDSSDATKNDEGTVKVQAVDDTVLEGRASDDILIGTVGQDDQLYGRSGNDTLIYDSADSVIDGGENLTGNYDNDTLLLQGNDSIDFSALANDVIKNIETINLNDGDHTLSNLSLQDVLDMTDSSNDLVIKGDNGDSVALVGGDWQQGATNDGYVEYTNNTDPTVLLKVDEDIHVTAS